MAEAVDEASLLRSVESPIGCFVAGTLVHTKDGLKPIEQIEVGDWVLSKSESGEGEQAYKRVLNTFSFEDKDVWSIDYATTDTIGTSIVTGNHPFWVKDLGWTRADHLSCGSEVQLASGVWCQVFSISGLLRTDKEDIAWIRGGYGEASSHDDFGRLIDLRNQAVAIDYDVKNQVEFCEVNKSQSVQLYKTSVYNFEVEDFHTYYIGELGVWVHNTDCAEPGLAGTLKKFEVVPGPHANVYSQAQAKALAPPHKGIILVEKGRKGSGLAKQHQSKLTSTNGKTFKNRIPRRAVSPHLAGRQA